MTKASALRYLWFALLLCLLPHGAHAQTINAATCNSTDVQSALNSVKADGTTVIVPAGSCTWSGVVTYNQAFSTTIQGQSTCTNAGTANVSCSDITTITGGDSYLTIATASGKMMRITGITWQVGPTFNGLFRITGGTQSLRIDHNHFYHMQAVAIVDGPLGVIDHNFFDFNTSQSVFNGVRVGNGRWNGYNWGDGSWADTSQFGSSKFLFFEDNTAYMGFINDCNDGGRFVIRHNYFHNAAMQGHEMESRMQGCRAWEAYANTFFADSNQQSGADTSSAMLFRTGTGLLWGNTVNYQTLVNFNNDRSDTSHGFTAPSAACITGGGAFNCWGYACNGGGSVGTSCTAGSSLPFSPSGFDRNTDQFGYPATQQIGRGKGDLFPQFDFNSPSFWSAGEPRWHNNQLEPVYLWSNNFTPPFGSSYVGSPIGASLIQQNRDWYYDYNGATGVRTGTSLPSTCAPLQAFWNSSTNTLFQCATANTWSAYYQPFTYPHPLVVGTGTPPTPPTNVQVIVQ